MEIVAERDTCYPWEESQQALFASYKNNHCLIQSKRPLGSQFKEGRGWCTWKSGTWGIFWNVYSQNVQVSQQRECTQPRLCHLLADSLLCAPQESGLDSCSLTSNHFHCWAPHYPSQLCHFLLYDHGDHGPVITLSELWFSYRRK